MSELDYKFIQSKLNDAERFTVEQHDPHLATYPLRDIVDCTEFAPDYRDLVWACNKSGNVHKNDILPIIDELRERLKGELTDNAHPDFPT